MSTAPSTPTRRAAILVLVTLLAAVIEVVQRESALKILLSAWLPALVLAVYWTRGRCRSALR